MAARKASSDTLSKRVAELKAELAKCRRELRAAQRRGAKTDTPSAEDQSYRALVENVNIGVYRNTGGPKGRFIRVNPAIVRMFGYDTMDEFLQVGVADLYQDAADRARFVEEVRRGGGVKDRELRLRRKDGSSIWASCTARATFDEAGQVAFMDGVIEDITERKEQEESERRFRNTLAALHEVMLELSSCETVDDACRRAVELGRTRLGFDRIGIWFLGKRPYVLRGSYGTDERGEMRDERGIEGRVRPDSPDGRALGGEEWVAVEEVAAAPDWDTPARARRAKAVAPLRDAEKVIGTVGVDNLLTGRPITQNDGQILALYAALLGHLFSRLRAEETLRELNRTLGERVAERTAELEEAGRSFRESEERYRTLAETAREFIFIVGPDLHVRYVNTYAARALRRAPETIAGMSLDQLFAPDVAQRMNARLSRVLETGQPQNYEELAAFQHAPDRTIWMDTQLTALRDDAGHAAGVLGVTRDMTARKVAEEALRASEARYRAVVEDQTEFICRFRPDGTVTFVNQALCRYFGRSEDELIGQSFFPTVHPDDRDHVRRHLDLLTPDNPVSTVEDRDVLPNGEVRWMQWTNRKIFDDAGNLVELQAVGRDVTERIRTERDMRESEERYRMLFELGADSVVVIDVETGDLVDFNRYAHENLGYSREEFAALHLADLDVLETAGAAADHVQRIVREGNETFETKQHTKDGRIRDVEVRARVMSIGGRRYLQSVWRDITDQKRADEALRESEERYRAIYEAVPDAMALYDPQSLQFVDVNDVFIRQYGYSREELAGRDIRLVIHPENWDETRSQIEANLRRPGPGRTPAHRHCRKDGTILWVDAVGTFVDVRGRRLRLVILRDVTEAIQAQQRIEQQALLLANVTDAVVVVRSNRTVAYWNRAAEQMSGYSESEMLGRKGLAVIVHNPEQIPEIDREITEEIAAGRVWAHDRLHGRRKDGTDVWVNVRASAVPLGPEGAKGALFVVRDITEEVRLQERLIRSARLATVGTLALSVTHELNNMLGGLRTLAEAAVGAPDLVPRLIDACRTVGEHGGVIASRMTMLARAATPGEERRIDLTNVVRTVVAMMTPSLAPRNIALSESYAEVPPTWANEGGILQILLNLLTNARDSVGRDGRVSVSVAHDPAANQIVLTVRDTGAGIRPEDRARLFEPFFTTKTEPDSVTGEPTHLGLGLSETYTIVRGYGGRIDVESEPGRGAAFIVRLPVRSMPTTTMRAPAPKAALPPKGTRMLVVDDQELIRVPLEASLQQQGYEVVTVTNGAEALAALAAGRFAYVFLDVLIPGEVSAAAVSRALRERQPEARLILCTACAPEDIPPDCLRNAFALLKKSFGLSDVPLALTGRGNYPMGR